MRESYLKIKKSESGERDNNAVVRVCVSLELKTQVLKCCSATSKDQSAGYSRFNLCFITDKSWVCLLSVGMLLNYRNVEDFRFFRVKGVFPFNVM